MLVGIAGILETGNQIKSCCNEGHISGSEHYSGIVGKNKAGDSAVEDCRDEYKDE